MSYIFDLFFVFISITINDYNSHSCFFGTFLSQVSACVLYKSVAYQKRVTKQEYSCMQRLLAIFIIVTEIKVAAIIIIMIVKILIIIAWRS